MPRADRLGRELLGAVVLLVGFISGAFVRERAAPVGREVHGHEVRDTRPGAVVGVAIGLMAGLAIAVVLSAWLLGRVSGVPLTMAPPEGGVANVPRRIPTEVRSERMREIADLRAREAELLGSYGWVDRTAGIVRIPIDRAMALVAVEGLPARPGPNPFRHPVASGPASGRFVADGQP